MGANTSSVNAFLAPDAGRQLKTSGKHGVARPVGRPRAHVNARATDPSGRMQPDYAVTGGPVRHWPKPWRRAARHGAAKNQTRYNHAYAPDHKPNKSTVASTPARPPGTVQSRRTLVFGAARGRPPFRVGASAPSAPDRRVDDTDAINTTAARHHEVGAVDGRSCNVRAGTRQHRHKERLTGFVALSLTSAPVPCSQWSRVGCHRRLSGAVAAAPIAHRMLPLVPWAAVVRVQRLILAYVIM